METNQTVPTSAQQLDLITRMIEEARGNVKRGGFFFLFWGWVIFFAELGHYGIANFTDYNHPYIVWLITIPAFIYSMIKGYQMGKNAQVTTHIDKIQMWLWYSFAVSVFLLVFFGYKIGWNLNPVIMLMAGAATFMSGIIIRFKPLLWGGIAFWLFAIACYLADVNTSYLFGAAGIFCGYLIPGYLLKRSTK